MTEFQFVTDLPSASGAREKNSMYSEFRDALRARPGEWAEYPKVFEGPNANKLTYQCAAYISSRGKAWVGFEGAARNGKVYARYVGESVDA